MYVTQSSNWLRVGENMQYLDILYSTQAFCKLDNSFWQCVMYWYVNEGTGIMNIGIYL
jgi:hypothetical protein